MEMSKEFHQQPEELGQSQEIFALLDIGIPWNDLLPDTMPVHFGKAGPVMLHMGKTQNECLDWFLDNFIQAFNAFK